MKQPLTRQDRIEYYQAKIKVINAKIDAIDTDNILAPGWMDRIREKQAYDATIVQYRQIIMNLRNNLPSHGAPLGGPSGVIIRY